MRCADTCDRALNLSIYRDEIAVSRCCAQYRARRGNSILRINVRERRKDTIMVRFARLVGERASLREEWSSHSGRIPSRESSSFARVTSSLLWRPIGLIALCSIRRRREMPRFGQFTWKLYQFHLWGKYIYTCRAPPLPPTGRSPSCSACYRRTF